VNQRLLTGILTQVTFKGNRLLVAPGKNLKKVTTSQNVSAYLLSPAPMSGKTLLI
jgi:hypothetical protein